MASIARERKLGTDDAIVSPETQLASQTSAELQQRSLCYADSGFADVKAFENGERPFLVFPFYPEGAMALIDCLLGWATRIGQVNKASQRAVNLLSLLPIVPCKGISAMLFCVGDGLEYNHEP